MIVNQDILRTIIVVNNVIVNAQIVVVVLLIVYSVLQEDQDQHANAIQEHMNQMNLAINV